MPINLENFTLLHVAISLAAIASGFIVVFGLIAGKHLGPWAASFLAATAATSITGFGFPIRGFTPGIGLAILSLLVLPVAAYALYARHLAGGWRGAYVAASVIVLYFNFFVLIAQSFQKIPPLKALAPTQSEWPFAAAQAVALAAFIALGTLAAIKFRERQPALAA